MAAKKITRKELLKEPDEFISTSAKVIAYSRQNPKKVVMGVVIVVACLLAVMSFYAYQRHGKLASHELFDRAFQEYQMMESSSQAPTSEQLDKLLEEFEVITRDYASFPAGEMALLYSGHVLYKKGDFSRALDRYTKMQSTSLAKDGLSPLILYHIAMTRLALKDYEQATVLFDQLSKDTNSPYRREAHAAIARIYETLGKDKEAVQAYKQYLKMFPEAPDAAFVKSKIAELSIRG
ncbi:MAG TPA: tetratricopeptide repeat protein [Desulfomonilaceae bacterium]|nr:tetratricopeptide repeat protein [Desulfomonilaceae bacterium]